MSAPLTCPNGHPVSSQDIACPNCKTILQQDRIPLPTPANIPSIPGYEILGELGRGGMGVVFKARQVSLKRLVALKMIIGGSLADAQDLARFRAEAAAVARLQHPNIVQIYAVDEHAGLPFLSLEFVEGGSLSEYLHGVPQPARAAALLVETLARAMHDVHKGGIVHRDLKPANILLQSADLRLSTDDANSQSPTINLKTAIPKITDFGLAKQLGASRHLTPAGAVLGTPSYMAPEQAVGKPDDIGPAADIYALGAILYEALTGRPPFLGETPVHTLQQVLHEKLVPPKELQPTIPADLDTICRKCLHREPLRRFDSALALAEDLRRYLDYKPIVTRPVGVMERGWSWCRRNPWLAGLAATVVLTLVTGTIVSTYLALWALDGQTKLQEQKNQLEEGQRLLRIQADTLKNQLYVAKMARVQQAWEDGQITRFQELLGEQAQELQGFEWRYWHGLIERNPRLTFLPGETPADLIDVVFSPDGRQLAALSKEGVVKAWDASSRKLSFADNGFKAVPGRLLFSPDGRYLAGLAAEDQSLRVWDTSTGQEVKLKDAAQVNHLVFIPDSAGKRQRLAAATQDRRIKVWDMTTGQATTLGPHSGNITAIGCSRDGKRLAAASFRPDPKPQNQGAIKIWNTENGREADVLKGDLDVILFLSFSGDARRLVTVARDQTVRLWDLALAQEHGRALFGARTVGLAGSPFGYGSLLATSALVPNELRTHRVPGGGKLNNAAFSPDGRRLAYTSGDDTVHVWDTATLDTDRALVGHADQVTRVAFSADGGFLATASLDQTVKVWDPVTGRALRTFKGHAGPVRALAFAPKGARLASGSADGTVLVWQADQDQEAVSLPAFASPVTAAAFAPRSLFLACAHEDGTVHLVPGAAGRDGHLLKGHDGRVTCLAVSPDGRHFATGGSDKTVLLWAIDKQEPVRVLGGHAHVITCLAFSPDGRSLASAARAFDEDGALSLGAVKVWNVDSGEEFSFPLLPATIVRLKFAEGGQALAGVTENGGVQFWDSVTGRALRSLQGPATRITSAAFSPDGETYAVARGHMVEVWGLNTGGKKHTLKGYDSPVHCLTYNPSGKRLASAYKDGSIKVWHVVLGQEVLTLKGHHGAVKCLAFSDDGQALATADDRAHVKVWFASNAAQLSAR